MKRRPWFLYRMRCLVDGVGDYFGITMRPTSRIYEHMRLKRGSKLRAAIDLFGPNSFVFEIINRFDTERDARSAEAASIIKYKTGWPDGLNVKGSGRRTSYVASNISDPLSQLRKAQISLWDFERKKQKNAERALRKVLGLTERDVRSANGKLKKRDDVFIERQRRGATGRPKSAITLEKHKAAGKAMWKNTETVEKMKRRKRGVISAEKRKEISETKKAIWANQASREQYVKVMTSAWSGAKGEARKQKLRERWADPEFKEKNVAAMQAKRPDYSDQNVLAALSAGQKKRHERERLLQNPQGSC